MGIKKPQCDCFTSSGKYAVFMFDVGIALISGSPKYLILFLTQISHWIYPCGRYLWIYSGTLYSSASL